MTTSSISTQKVFNGIYTLENKETGTYTTFKIHTVRKGKLEGKRLVSRLVGPNNQFSYQGIGFVNDNGTVKLWNRFNNQKYKQMMNILFSLINNGDDSRFANRVNLKLSKRCIRCNRTLTTPQSIELGIGPECQKNMF